MFFEFRHNPDKWYGVARFVDDRTGASPVGINEQPESQYGETTGDYGLKKVKVHGEFDYNTYFSATSMQNTLYGWQATP